MTEYSLPNGQLFERDPDLVHADVDGEAVMMSISRSSYFGLNEVGTRIWALLAAPASVEQICGRLSEEYDVDSVECRQQVEAFLGELLRQGIVRPCPNP